MLVETADVSTYLFGSLGWEDETLFDSIFNRRVDAGYELDLRELLELLFVRFHLASMRS